MTEASENAYLVRVRAQVMCRDEGTGGWVALGGGGLADVMVGRRPAVPAGPAVHAHRISAGGGDGNGDATSTSAIVPAPAHEYYIHGKRISDNMVVLECTVKKDFQYNKVMPTFHHWVTDEKRFGLTFQTAADARAFDKGVRTAIEELLDGLGGAWPSLHTYKKHNPAPKEDDEEHNIFECLNLPSGREDGNGRRDLQTPILAPINLTTHPLNGHESMKQYEVQYEEKTSTEDDTERCHYVQLSAVHEYTYPQVGQGGVITSEKSTPNTKPPLLKRDSGSLKKSSYSAPPPLPGKKAIETFQGRIKCRHCHEWYLESANRAGSCEYAPDCCRTCVDCLSCIKCAQCLVYHCGWDSEGDAVNRPCACAPPHTTCAVRWVAIVALSLVVPCLCCYVPLRCVHRAARAAHLAGEPHAPHAPHQQHLQHAHAPHVPHAEHD